MFFSKEWMRTMTTLERGKELFRQGEEAGCFYIVISGAVELLRDAQKIMDMGTDSVLGAEPLFTPGGKHLYTARASEALRVSRCQYPELLDMLGAQPALFRKILDSMCLQNGTFWSRAGHVPEQYFLGEIRTYEPGQWVIREGGDDTEIFRIVAAEKGLEVTRQGHLLTILETRGDFFGEMASILGEKRTASVRSLGQSILEIYPGDKLAGILNDYPQVSMRIITDLSRRLAETTRSLTLS